MGVYHRRERMVSGLLLVAAALGIVDAFVPSRPTAGVSVVVRTWMTSESRETEGEKSVDMLQAAEDDDDDEEESTTTTEKLKSSRWDALNPRIKTRIIKAGQERAIANKQKVEPLQTKKRRKF